MYAEIGAFHELWLLLRISLGTLLDSKKIPAAVNDPAVMKYPDLLSDY